MQLIFGAEGFDWDEGNLHKSRRKHRVSVAECEELFFSHPLLVATDVIHSNAEARFLALGKTEMGRRLFVAFTIRGKRIRIISARAMSRKERAVYEKAEKDNEVVE